ncbi:MAG: glycosyltransferase [Gaiellaceae bacterium]
MRISIVDTCYPAFLASHYAANPHLAGQQYDVQWRSLMDQFFGTSDSYSHHLSAHGHPAHEFIVNCRPLQERWADEHRLSLPTPRFRGDRRRREAILLAQVKEFRPDVCYVQNLEILGNSTIAELRRLGIMLVGQLSTEPPPLRRLRLFDLIVTPVPPLAEKLAHAHIRTDFLPLAFDVRAAERAGPRPSQPPWGAVFVGSLKRYRRWASNTTVARAAERTHIDFWGYGERQWSRRSSVRRSYHGNAWGLDMLRVLRDARIGINRHGDFGGDYASNMRLYEATGMGTLLLTDAKVNLGSLFEVGREAVSYANEDELVGAIDHYLTAEDEREAIAVAGRARTFTDHSYDRRMGQLAALIAGAR